MNTAFLLADCRQLIHHQANLITWSHKVNEIIDSILVSAGPFSSPDQKLLKLGSYVFYALVCEVPLRAPHS
jgi:hypothetical protein